MNAQGIFADARVAHVRELKAEVARLKAELASAQNSLRAWENHFADALLAAFDADRLEPGGELLVVDGWNAQFAAGVDKDRHAVVDAAKAWLAAHPKARAWVVFDGDRANARCEGRLRVSFTGGQGPHRADKAICDFVHMLRRTGRATPVTVVTRDKDFRKKAEALGARVVGAIE
ncbi:MAG: NYN domain-containing protein [Kiritimatiellae bacterium]|nr:NYN domain-containing protein [Kiritimatiellia bacterium]